MTAAARPIAGERWYDERGTYPPVTVLMCGETNVLVRYENDDLTVLTLPVFLSLYTRDAA